MAPEKGPSCYVIMGIEVEMTELYSVDYSAEASENYHDFLEACRETGFKIYLVNESTCVVSKFDLNQKQKKAILNGIRKIGIDLKRVSKALPKSWKVSRPVSDFLENLKEGAAFKEEYFESDDIGGPLYNSLYDLGFHVVYHAEFMLYSTDERIYDEGPMLGMDEEP